MATERTSTHGKWIVVADSTTADTDAGNIAVVFGRKGNDDKAGDNRTSLAIYEGQPEFDKMIQELKAADPDSTTLVQVLQDQAKLVLPDCNNRKLSTIFGAGNWRALFDPETSRVDPNLLGKDRAGRRVDLLVGKTFTALVPVVDNGVIREVKATWKIFPAVRLASTW